MLCNNIASDEFFKTNECTQIVCKFVYDNHKKYHFPIFLSEIIYKTSYKKYVNKKNHKINIKNGRKNK